ncbi:hypothetical protein C2G38_2183493 [Gigaspora rosea]|uniref:Uncharacterized protein n=1 Tax=Gigaspora rosea TaxID=44941 RepID=A0A397VHR4_9GLOM|nr:hypothetical protein C2G38_2183493 [Gigaspora rosea]
MDSSDPSSVNLGSESGKALAATLCKNFMLIYWSLGRNKIKQVETSGENQANSLDLCWNKLRLYPLLCRGSQANLAV